MDPRVVARRLVSQNKKRLVVDGFDLDLSYITEQIIAMGLPASGLEGQYRNPIAAVVQFMEDKHKGCYKIFNLCSEKVYDVTNFDGFVANFPFDDHNCPQLDMIPVFCASAKEWLKAGMDNVVCVHCKAGKSRTGLMISALLLYLGYFDTAREARAFFNVKRTKDGRGLVLPSQVRYLYYYEHVFHHGLPAPSPRTLSCVSVHGAPGWKAPVRVSVLRQDRSVVAVESLVRTGPKTSALALTCNVPIEGDIKIEFREPGAVGRVLCYTWLHTAYAPSIVRLREGEMDKLKDKKAVVAGEFLVVLVLDKGGVCEIVGPGEMTGEGEEGEGAEKEKGQQGRKEQKEEQKAEEEKEEQKEQKEEAKEQKEEQKEQKEEEQQKEEKEEQKEEQKAEEEAEEEEEAKGE